MIADELLHTIKQAVQQAMIDQRPFVYGHIASYDPNGHRVRCLIPSYQDENGVPLLTPWLPMGTLSAGAGYGLQIIYRGGATAQNPTAGEQVLIGLFDRQRGVSAVPAMHFHDQARPPATNMPAGASPAVTDDVLLSNASGTLVRIHANGDFELIGTGKFLVTTTGDANITTQGNATITVKGSATIAAAAINLTKAVGDALQTLQTLCTKAFFTWAASHTHPNTGAPSSPPPANGLTSIVQAE